MTRRAQERDTRGYFGVAVWNPKRDENIGGIMRSAFIFGAAFIAVFGERYKRQNSDTVFAARHVPLFQYADPLAFWEHLPEDCQPVVAELHERSKPLTTFTHPTRAVYIVGPEDGDVPDFITERSAIVQIPGRHCLNVNVAASIVMYDRVAKRGMP